MKIIRQIQNTVLILLCGSMAAYGQHNTDFNEIRQILSDLKNTGEISYDYSIHTKYPNDQKDHVKGEVYINNERKIMYNLTDAFSMIYSGNWFYRADHRKKTVTVINLNKESEQEYKRDAVEKDIFQNGAMKNFVDSVLLKRATIKSFKKHGDTLRATLGFPEGMNVTALSIVYSEKNKMLVRYDMNMFQPMERKKGQISGITEVVSCDNFRKEGNKKIYKLDNFFTVNKDKLILNKYDKYKLYSKL